MARLLIDAILNGEESLALSLIQAGTYGCIDSQTSRRDGTALFFCCSRGFLELARMLIKRGANVNSQNKSLATPLHAAADWGYVGIVRLLLDEGADLNAKNHRGDSALHLAAYRGHEEVTRCLVERGAILGAVNSLQVTAENEARSQGHEQLAGYLRGVEIAQNPGVMTDGLSTDFLSLDPPRDLIGGSTSSSQSHGQLDSIQQHKHQQQQEQQRRHSHCVNECRPSSHSNNFSYNQNNSLSFILLDPPLSTRPPSVKHESAASRKPVESTWGCVPQSSQGGSCPHSPLAGNYRRPSTCSTGSCLSEISGSDSISSGVSSCQSESRKGDDIDFLPDQQALLNLPPSSGSTTHYKFSQLPSKPTPPCHMYTPNFQTDFDPSYTRRSISQPHSNSLQVPNGRLPRRLSSIAAPPSAHSEFADIFQSGQFSAHPGMSLMVPTSSKSTGSSSGPSSIDFDFLNGSSSDFSSLMSSDSDDIKKSFPLPAPPQPSSNYSSRQIHPQQSFQQQQYPQAPGEQVLRGTVRSSNRPYIGSNVSSPKGRQGLSRAVSVHGQNDLSRVYLPQTLSGFSNSKRSPPAQTSLHKTLDADPTSSGVLGINDLSSGTFLSGESHGGLSSMTCVNIPIK